LNVILELLKIEKMEQGLLNLGLKKMPRCKAITLSGKRCRKNTSIGSLCMGHYYAFRNKLKRRKEKNG